MKVSKIAATVLTALGLALSAGAHAETVLKLGYTPTKDSHYAAGADAFAEELAKRTNGRFKVQQFPASALGGEREMIEAVQLGTQDMVLTSTGPVGNFVPEARIVDIPFLFRDYDHAHKVLDGQIGQDLLKKFPGKGLVALAWYENGFRHITNNKRPVNSPEDVKGLKLRTMENKVHMEAFKTMGVLPTPMSMAELFTALQQGTVDGQENPIPVILSNKLYQVQKNVSLTGHVYSPALLIISPSVWGSLSDADKKAFMEAAKAGVEANRKRVTADEASGVATIKAAGVQVVEKVDHTQFAKAVQPAYTVFAKEFGADRIKQIQDVR
ncbi:2,3-diketo-L-gulonate-binding periplasmic protein YiaO precursor [Azoarcus sp. Aa7]|nr:2,3-diketo-L-gulonate-binding periplasmic protein YiaO precursor [Azoarcus sp. Aa7]